MCPRFWAQNVTVLKTGRKKVWNRLRKKGPNRFHTFFLKPRFFRRFSRPRGGKNWVFRDFVENRKIRRKLDFSQKIVFLDPPRVGGWTPPSRGVAVWCPAYMVWCWGGRMKTHRQMSEVPRIFFTTSKIFSRSSAQDLDELPMSSPTAVTLLGFFRNCEFGTWSHGVRVWGVAWGRVIDVRSPPTVGGLSSSWKFFYTRSFKIFQDALVGRQHPSTPELGFRKVRDLIDTPHCIIDPRSELFDGSSGQTKKFLENLFEVETFLWPSSMSSSSVWKNSITDDKKL